ncbi:hypothetical protein B0H14DRAFT_2566752 [Mycena olivaceomarginata]|nr:hypothetical protein B0H14DRAFT_2566752 [Mycena olivaceomarginata]
MYKHPCTNIPIKCPLDCDQFHWKYNFQQHLILSQYFLSTIHISSAEQEALGIPRGRCHWRCTSQSLKGPPPSRGRKQPASSPPNSPSRRANKENEGIPAIDSRAVRPPKIRKLI